ncbi:hypothetical protein KAH94_04480 [bacterium]|nr:hypothetical protein [bacterium]
MKDQVRYKKWIKAVLKKNYGKCPCCGGKPTGGIHHIFPRGAKRTKFIVENGIPTCFEFHRLWENPLYFRNLINIHVGAEKYTKLKKLANGYISLEESGFTEIKK